MNVWQARNAEGTAVVDFPTPEEAIAAVEARGHGSVVRFRLERNMPGCLPELVHRSSAMWRYEDGEWSQWSIFTGRSENLGEDRPN